jgi:sialidase-1
MARTLVLVAAAAAVEVATALPPLVDVFASGEEGYAC